MCYHKRFIFTACGHSAFSTTVVGQPCEFAQDANTTNSSHSSSRILSSVSITNGNCSISETGVNQTDHAPVCLVVQSHARHTMRLNRACARCETKMRRIEGLGRKVREGFKELDGVLERVKERERRRRSRVSTAAARD
jgi:hypothetical protein